MPSRTTLGTLARSGTIEFSDGYRTRRDELGFPGVPILRVAETLDGRLAPTFEEHVLNQFRPAFARKVSRPGDVIVTTKGTVGRVARIRVSDPEFVYSPQLCFFRVVDQMRLDPEWLYWWFRGKEFQTQVRSIRDQTDMAAYVNLADLGMLAVTVPELSNQRAIAEVLGALDDKIEADVRLGDLLGALAGVIFAQMFEQDADGPWIRVGAAAEVVDCLHSKKPDYLQGGSRYLVLDDIRQDGRLNVVPNFAIGLTDYAEWTRRIEVSSGDCIITNVGRVGAVAQIPPGTKAAIGRNMTAIRVNEKRLEAYMIEALRSKSVLKEIAAKTDQGTILSALNVRSIPELVLPFGTPGTCERFQMVVEPLHELQDALLRESAALAGLRDTLLPRLLSGELQVREADTLVEDAV